MNSLLQDEDIYTFFEPDLPFETKPIMRPKVADPDKPSIPHLPANHNGPKPTRFKKQRSLSAIERKIINPLTYAVWRPTMQDKLSLHEGSSVLDLKGDNYFSCAVARKRSSARYLLSSSDDVVNLLRELAECNIPS